MIRPPPKLSSSGAWGRVVVYDFDDVGEGDFNYLAVGALYFDAGLCQRLRRLHTADDAAHAIAVFRDNLYVVFTVKRLERCKGFGNFHDVGFLLVAGSWPGQRVLRN